ncbi:MAG: NucA/NucB deoxyribonuclease domain-containing protein, partial [Angustibacter sp.]
DHDEPDYLTTVATLLRRTRITGYGYPTQEDAPSQAAARAVTSQCRANALPGRYTKTNCNTLPIFAPGTDIKEAAEHDHDAIRAGQPALLQYATPEENAARGVPPGWYEFSLNRPNNCTGETGLESGTDCDEYPYASTRQAGSGASLKPVNSADNRREGRLLNGFYEACSLKNIPRKDFITVPTVKIAPMPTTGWC